MATRNRLLARLPQSELDRLKLRLIPMKFEESLSEAQSAITHVYFPISGVVSAITVMNDGTQIEVATIGNEGMVDIVAFMGARESPHRLLIQVGGEAYRMDVKAFQAEAKRDGPFKVLMGKYLTAYHYQISQAIACNGLHKIQPRCCRWILQTHDRAGSDEFPLTHEFLSHMLGVRRVSITDVLKPLQDEGLIRGSRGRITVLNRKKLEQTSCECYQTVKDEYDRLIG
jgi:CRP-like cAMP-binding protein